MLESEENMEIISNIGSSTLQSGQNPHELYENSTYMVVSKVAYLIGVPKSIFENKHEPPQLEWYEEMDREKDARIIRNLCIVNSELFCFLTDFHETTFAIVLTKIPNFPLPEP